MTTARPQVVLPDFLSGKFVGGYRTLPSAQELDLVPLEGGVGADNLVEILPQADFLLVRRRVLTADMLARATRLRAVVAVGMRQRIDEQALASRGIPIECLPRYTAMAVADLALAMMLNVSREVVRGHLGIVAADYRRRGLVPRATSETEVSFNWLGLNDVGPLYGKRLGLVGFGEIGSQVALRARAFGMSVRYYQRHPLPPAEEAKYGATSSPLSDLLPWADFISLHLPDTPDSRGLLSRENLERMKPGAYLINTSRGHLVDEPALAELLASGRLGGAGLDVFWEEPLPADSPLARLPNVVLTPHAGASGTKTVNAEMEAAMARIVEIWRERR